MLEYCVLENWDVGSLEKSLLTCEGEYQEMEILLLNQHSIILRARFTPLSPRKRVPSFHHSLAQTWLARPEFHGHCLANMTVTKMFPLKSRQGGPLFPARLA